MQSLAPEDTIRIHSASDEGAAIIQARRTSPITCFQSLEFKVLLYLRLGIPIAARDVNWSHCAETQLSNRHLVNGCPHKNYKHRKHKAIMSEIVDLCAAANILVAEEQFQCFNTRTSRRIDLVFTIDTTEVLVDVTTIDANNPSNGFLRGSGLSPLYFPGAASVMKNKWERAGLLNVRTTCLGGGVVTEYDSERGPLNIAWLNLLPQVALCLLLLSRPQIAFSTSN